MRKILFLIFTSLFLNNYTNAQKNARHWSEGKLTWNDFKEKESTHNISDLKYYFGYKTEKQRFGDTTVLRIKAESYMDKNLSWVHPNYKTEQLLKYNQVLFDIVELYRRKLQYDIDQINFMYELEGKFNYTLDLCNKEIDQYYSETNEGQDFSMIQKWENQISNELNDFPINKLPSLKLSKFGYSFNIGLGSGAFVGTLGEYFTPSFNILLGFDFQYKKSVLYLNASLGFDKVKKDFATDKNWNKGQSSSASIVELCYGYAVIDNSKFKLSPYAGLGITEFALNSKVKENNTQMVDYNISFGLNFDYKYKENLNLIPRSILSIREKATYTLRTKLFVTKANYSQNIKGYTINLGLLFCGFGNFIYTKN